jgi:hypothetical protein
VIAELEAVQSIYLYGFTLPGSVVPSMLGIDDRHPVRLYANAGLNAVISSVALSDFTGETGENNLQNVAWLTPRACRHALVLDKLMAEGAAVYPLAFGTLFSSLSAMEQEMAQRSADVLMVLQHIIGCQEWCLEATLDSDQAIDALLAEGLRTGRFSLPDAAGRRHLEEQKLRRSLTAEVNDWLAECLSGFQQLLSPLVRDFRSRRLLDNKILHWAYLLPLDKVVAFQQQVAEIASRYEAYGFSFRVTGPWPAYSFAQCLEP